MPFYKPCDAPACQSLLEYLTGLQCFAYNQPSLPLLAPSAGALVVPADLRPLLLSDWQLYLHHLPSHNFLQLMQSNRIGRHLCVRCERSVHTERLM